MVNTIFIFGNGLGRAICNEYFSLERVLKDAWESGDVLTERQKQLIQSCLPQDVLEEDEGAPTSERDLNDLHRVLSACDTIKIFEERIPGDGGNWLNEQGLEFPAAIRRYLHNAACRFNYAAPGVLNLGDRTLPAQFQENLRNFIMKEGAHVVTLNYDDLLYECFSETDVFIQRRLRDGFFNGSFDFGRHEQLIDASREGWFLHLHGSPLFINRAGEPKKITRAELTDYIGNESSHLVLTSVQHKRAVIQSSEILRTYWEQLEKVVPKCKNVVLFGYGGEDIHINEQLRHLDGASKLRVVEFDDGADTETRTSFWKRVLDRDDLSVVRMPNILSFDMWATDTPL